jgi:hypothetical protein
MLPLVVWLIQDHVVAAFVEGWILSTTFHRLWQIWER